MEDGVIEQGTLLWERFSTATEKQQLKGAVQNRFHKNHVLKWFIAELSEPQLWLRR